ncbi:apical protein/shroom-related [Holotrichia oblita]|uniref:Apical protein/shroom-related n=1 Tax=Holotrichia oblita TaxID=644536 RepID=A0ACB9TVI2_HOLOL|nr:apical protein/shroom-related [Holotrichia oblita]
MPARYFYREEVTLAFTSILKSVKYGPGHEKFPSWPVPAAAEAPQALRVPPSGGSHRSKSWTDHTNYPKEKVVTYTRPYMKRQNSSHIQQKLKTVMEKCEKIPPETYESHFDKINDRLYLPHVDRDGKALGDMEYNVPSPPERDINKPQLTQEELEEYARSYQESSVEKYGHYNPDMKGLENFIEYARSYEEYHINQKHDATVLTHLHQKQLSYAQSEGYHSYVSSTDSTSTPFLDRLRRDSEAVPARQSDSWDDITEPEPVNIRREGRDSVVTTSSGSASSSETLKWHGSMSDVSVASSSHLANSSISSVQRQQLIAHSARVQTPQRHHSESVLYMGGENQENWKDRENRNNNTNKLKLFAVNTYTVQSDEHKNLEQGLTQPQQVSNRISQPSLSVADRINELEKQQKYSYLDPDKKHKVPDPTLKAIQKKALLSFYERHHNSSSSHPNTTNKTNTWRSEPQLAQSQSTLVQAPQPPPRIKAQTPTRRASCASDYASNNNSKRSSFASSRENRESGSARSKSGSPTPSPPTVLEDEVINSDEPLPPPPTELENSDWQTMFDDRLKENRTRHQFATAQVETGHKTVQDTVIHKELCLELPRKSTVGILERGGPRYSSVRHVPNEHKLIFSESRHHPSDNKDGINDKSGHSDNRHVVGESRLIDDKHRHSTDGLLHNESRHSQNDNSKKHASDIRLSSDNRSFAVENTHQFKSPVKEQPVFGFPNQRNYAERSSARYPPMHKLILNGNIAVSQKIINGVCDQYRAEPLRSVSLKDDEKLLAVSSIRGNQRASIAEGSPRDIPPPLQPRQMRINQSMRARIPEGRPGGITTRNSPLRDEKVRDTKQSNYSM